MRSTSRCRRWAISPSPLPLAACPAPSPPITVREPPPYVQANSTDVSAASLTANAVTHWYFISGVDVMAPAAAKGIVAIGDSITDGRGVDVDANNRWTDVLAERLHANAATANVSLMNQGIGATTLTGGNAATDPRPLKLALPEMCWGKAASNTRSFTMA